MQTPPLSAQDEKLQEQLLSEKQLTPAQLKQALASRDASWQSALDELQGISCILTPNCLQLSDFPSGKQLAEIPLRNQPGTAWGDQLVFVDPEDGRLLQTSPLPSQPGLLITADGSYGFSSDPAQLPCLGETLSISGNGLIDSDLTVSPKGDLLFVSERYHGKLHVISLITHKLLTSLKVRETGHTSAINLTVSPDTKRAYLTDQLSSRLWILDLGTWKLSPLQTGLGTLGNLALSPDQQFLFLTLLEPAFRMVYFDLHSLSVIQEIELQGSAASQHTGAPADLLTLSPDQKRLLFLTGSADENSQQMLVQVIRTRQARTIRRYPLPQGVQPLALLAGFENPLWELQQKSLGAWLVELGLLEAETLKRLGAGPTVSETPAPIVYSRPHPDEAPAELLQRPAPPITLPPDADDVMVEIVVRAFYQETEKNLRQHPVEIQKLFQNALDWRQALEHHYAVQAKVRHLLGRYNLNVLITRESLLQEVDKKFEGRELPFRPSHRCPLCQANLQAPRSCAECGFHLEDPEGSQRRAGLSAESCSELIPGQLLLALPQVNQVLLLNAWHEVICEYHLKPLGFTEPYHALALPNRNYLICDRKAPRVTELSSGGKVVRDLEHDFVEPVMSTFYHNQAGEIRILVVDRGAHEILEFDQAGEVRCSWGARHGLDLKQPRNVQRTWSDTLLITDTGNLRIVEVDRAGRILATWGPPQIPLVKPVMARREINGDTLIIDAGRGQIVAFNEARQLVRNFLYWPPPELKEKLADEPAPRRFLVQQRELIALSPKYWMQITVPLQQIRWIKPWTGDHRKQQALNLGPGKSESAALTLLRNMPFLKSASQETLELLESHLHPVLFKRGDMVLHQGELGSTMYFLLEGSVEVLKEGGEKPVAVLGPGNLFGEMALILSEPRIANVRCQSDCRLLQLERNDFNQVIASFPELAEHLRKLARERKALTHGFNHQKQQEVMHRIKARMAMNKLKELAFFSQIDEPLLETLADAMRPVAFMPKHVIFTQGESGERMYFITRGQAEVFLSGSEEPVAVLHNGDVLGEMALLFDQPRSATVRTVSYCQCFELDRHVFEHIAGQFPAFQAQLRVLADQRQHSNQDTLERIQASREAAAALDAAHAEAAAQIDAALAGAEVIGSAPHMVCYLLDTRNSELLAIDGKGEIRWRTGSQLGLFRPTRLQVEGDLVWIADTGHDRVIAVDLASREMLREVGNHLLPLMQPRSAVPTPQGNLLIADEGNQRLVLAGPQGNYLWEYSPPHEILSPCYAEQTPVGTFLFCDAALHMVFEIDPRNKEVVWSHGMMLISGNGSQELNEPACVRRLPNGNTLIADTGNHRLVLVSPKGQVLKIFKGTEQIPFNYPAHCEMLPNGEVLVWSRDEAEIIRLDLAGQPVWRARIPEMAML